MASIIKRGNVFYAQFYDSDRNPKRKRLSLRTKDKSTARALLAKFEKRYRLGESDPWVDDMHDEVQPDRKERLSVHEAVGRFLDKRVAMNCTRKTLKSYRGNLRRMLEGVNPESPFDRLDPAVPRSYIHDPDVAPATRAKRYRTIRAFLRYHNREVLLENTPKPLTDDKLPVACSEEELIELGDALQLDYQSLREKNLTEEGQVIWRLDAFWFAFYTGLRRKELARLKWKDVNLSTSHITLTKQKRRREERQPLSKKAVDLLKELPNQEPQRYVFVGPRAPAEDRHLESWGSRLTRSFAKYRDEAGLRPELTLHSLRAGYITRLAEAGLSAVAIKKLARHADIKTSLRYIQATGNTFREDLDAAFK